jgi:lipid-A-disaccharide synthase-like uncharacterized protein
LAVTDSWRAQTNAAKIQIAGPTGVWAIDLQAILGVSSRAEMIWISIGFLAQFVFGMRFIVQWIASERAGQSVIPVAFWYLSIGGGVIMLAYAIYRHDPVFIWGQGIGLAVYLRNITMILNAKRAKAVSSTAQK